MEDFWISGSGKFWWKSYCRREGSEKSEDLERQQPGIMFPEVPKDSGVFLRSPRLKMPPSSPLPPQQQQMRVFTDNQAFTRTWFGATTTTTITTATTTTTDKGIHR